MNVILKMVDKGKQAQFLQRLRFDNMVSLQSSTDLDNNVQVLINRLSSVKAYSHVEKLFDTAESQLKRGDEEHAFQLYTRMGLIAKMIIKKRDFQNFKQTPDGRRFYDIFKISVNNLLRLEDSLCRRYEIKATEMQYSAKEDQDSVPKESSTEQNDNKIIFQSKFLITPRQLVRYVEDRRHVLLIDYRKNQSSIIQYDNSEKILVAHIPYEVIVPGCIGSSLIRSVAIGERALLQRMSDVDLVVLLGDHSDGLKGGKIPVGSKEQILFNALFTYNTMHCLRCPPVFLDGGFENWVLHYPMYATNHVQVKRSFLNINDQTEFARAVAEYKKGIGIGLIEYPELTISTRSVDAKSDDSHPTRLAREISNSVTDEFERSLKMPIIEATSFLDRKLSAEKQPEFYKGEVEEERKSKIEEEKKLEIEELKEVTMKRKPTTVVPTPFVDRKTKPSTIQSQQYLEPSIPKETQGTSAPIVPPINGLSTLDENRIETGRKPTPERRTKPPFRKKRAELLVVVHDSMLKSIEASSCLQSVSSGYTGIKNLGNTCFMNATLQALSNTEHLRNIFTRSEFLRYVNTGNKMGTLGVISAAFSAVMDSLWSNSFLFINPYDFLELFASEVNSELANRGQHDAHEFLIYLLDSLHEDTNRVLVRESFEQNYNGRNLNSAAMDYERKSLNFSSSPVADMFNCRTISTLRCSTCNYESVTFEEVAQLSIEIPCSKTKAVTLLDCLIEHFEPVVLEGNSRWSCPKCNQLRVSVRNTRIWKFPKILVIHFKRFAHELGYWRKNTNLVDFNVSPMNLSSLLHPESMKNYSKDRTSNVFSLYAVTNHSGGLESGHYVTLAKNYLSNQWLHFDDERVTPINRNSVCSEKAYILYFVSDAA